MTVSSKDAIFLVGLMGAGKTTLGRLLAEYLGFDFYDTDEQVVARAGANIPWIFDVEGEAGFRERETAVLAEMVALKGVVVSTGGGIVTVPENREYLNSVQKVIYLSVSPRKLYSRIGKDSRRPLLQTDDPLKTLQDLFDIRDPLYRLVATDVIGTGGYSPKEALEKLKAVVAI